MNDLTLVLTTYNRCLLLKVMIESLQKQTDMDFNLIICDNHSTDGSWQYINNLNKFNNGAYIKLHWKENLGWAGSAKEWNIYINTKWTSIICDDDWLGNNFVRNIKSQITPEFDGIIISGHSRTNMAGEIHKIYDRNSEYIEPNHALEEFYQHKIEVAGISGFAVQTRLLNNGLFPRDYPSGLLEDTMICVRAISEGGVRLCKGNEYFRREFVGDNLVYMERMVDWPVAHALFRNDIKNLLRASNIDPSIIRIWTRNSLKYKLSYFIRAILLNDLSFDNYKKYIHFACKHDIKELIYSLFILPIFLFKGKPSRLIVSTILGLAQNKQTHS